ncbi:hypothetical protein ABIE33_003472 [Ensifer sp. 4252]
MQQSPGLFSRCPQTLVSGPQGRSLIKENRGKQMGICVANAHTENGVAINHHHDFVVRCDERLTLSLKESYHAPAIPKAAKCQFANHSRMAE